MFRHQAVQRHAGHAKFARGTRHVKACLLQLDTDCLALGMHPGLAQIACLARGSGGRLAQTQIVGGNQAPFAKHHRAPDPVDQLAHIAWPVVRADRLHRAVAKTLQRRILVRGVRPEKKLCKVWQIGLAFAQRRHLDGQHMQSIKKVFPEAPRRSCRLRGK